MACRQQKRLQTGAVNQQITKNSILIASIFLFPARRSNLQSSIQINQTSKINIVGANLKIKPPFSNEKTVADTTINAIDFFTVSVLIFLSVQRAPFQHSIYILHLLSRHNFLYHGLPENQNKQDNYNPSPSL